MSATDNTPHRAVQRGMNYPAVIPAAGMGTRFLPATKAIPKEMLPVVDRPAIQYVVEEAVGAGIDDVLFVVGRSKNPLVDHFDRVSDMEDLLQARGKLDLLAEVQRITELASFHFVRQAEPHGLGHAVLQARHHVRDSPFAVLLGDDIISDGDALLAHMMQVHQHTGANVVAVQEVPREQVSSYGVVALRESADPATSTVHPHDRWPALWVDTLVEKPAPAEAPSTLAVIGRYVLNPEVFEVLHRTGPGRGGEIQLTDALVEMAAHPEQYGGVVAVVHDGRRYDTGNKLEYLKATVELALAHPTLGPDLHDWLLTLAADLRDNPHPKKASHPALKPSTS